MNFRLLALIVPIIFACAPIVLQAQNQDAALIERILSDFRKREQATNSVIYSAEGTGFVPKGSKNLDLQGMGFATEGPVPAKDYAYEVEMRWLLDFKRQRVRRELRDHVFHLDKAIFHPRFEARMFDGESYQCYTPRDENTSAQSTPSEYQWELFLESKDELRYLFSIIDEAILLAHGKWPRLRSTDGPFDRLAGHDVDAAQFESVTSARYDGKECLVLRTRSLDPRKDRSLEFWVDPARDSAVLRLVHYRGREPGMELRNVQYQSTPKGWLPASFEAIERIGDQFVLQYSMRITAFEAAADFASSDFSMEAEPGTIVFDAVAQRHYKVGGDGEPDVSVRQLQAEGFGSGGGYKWWIIGASLAACAALYLMFRARRSPSRTIK